MCDLPSSGDTPLLPFPFPSLVSAARSEHSEADRSCMAVTAFVVGNGCSMRALAIIISLSSSQAAILQRPRTFCGPHHSLEVHFNHPLAPAKSDCRLYSSLKPAQVPTQFVVPVGASVLAIHTTGCLCLEAFTTLGMFWLSPSDAHQLTKYICDFMSPSTHGYYSHQLRVLYSTGLLQLAPMPTVLSRAPRFISQFITRRLIKTSIRRAQPSNPEYSINRYCI
jgi:hypothetical protein